MDAERINFEDKHFEKIVLVLFLLLQLWFFSGSFHKFFCNDSLFYMVNAPHSWHEFERFLLSPDEAKQYRPLNLGFVALVKPFWGLNPYPYHWIPLIFHLLNTALFFAIAKRILPGSLAALFAAGFWGFHSVAGWITYDITYLSDFFLAFLFLLSLMLALLAREKKSPPLFFASLLIFFLSLLTKEVAPTFPLGIWIGISLAEIRASRGAGDLKSLWAALKKTFPFISIYWVIAFVFAVLFLYWMKAGLLYTQGAGAAYDFNPWTNLIAKAKYIFWSLNLPDVLQIPYANKYRMIAFGLMGCLLALWCVDLLRRKVKLTAIEWGGLIWLVGLNVPALLLSHRLAKWYLYLPLFGLSLIIGVFAGNLGALLPKQDRRITGLLVLAILLAPVLFSSAVQTRSYIASSDCVFQSDVIQTYLDEFRASNPVVLPQSTVCLLPSFEEHAAKTLAAPPIDKGRLFELFYPNKGIQSLFETMGDRLPDDWLNRPGFSIFQWFNGRFFNVTQYYKDRTIEPGRRLIPLIDFGRIEVNRAEYYPDYKRFQTPNGLPAFFPTPEKDIVTQIAGAAINIPLGVIAPGSQLKMDVSWMNVLGDGAWAEVRLRTSGREEVLYRKYMQTNPQISSFRWESVRLNLDRYAQSSADLILRCYNDPGKNTIADWLHWRDIVITK